MRRESERTSVLNSKFSNKILAMDQHPPASVEEFITIACVLGTHGRCGEVVIQSRSDAPDRFKAGMKVSALAEDGSRRELELQELWLHKHNLVLKFSGIDSISEGEMLAGCELQVKRSERAQLEAGWSYISDLIGCTIFNADHVIGRIVDVRLGAGEAPLLIVQMSAREIEIPYAEAYVQSVEMDRKEIRLLLPEGMLDLDAPLTDEEKLQQRRSLK